VFTRKERQSYELDGGGGDRSRFHTIRAVRGKFGFVQASRFDACRADAIEYADAMTVDVGS
jgi:hypothetical protein